MNAIPTHTLKSNSLTLTDDCRSDFPILANQDNSFAYLDSGATTLKPTAVIDSVRWYMEQGTAAIHRGVHKQSIEATDRFEGTRELLAGWIGADRDEIVFTSGATAAIHLVRQGLIGLKRVAATVMEHHSNLVPWMDLESCVIVPVDKHGNIDMEVMEETLRKGVDLLAVAHISNVLGSVTPIKELIQLAHQCGAKVLIDAAQSISHCEIDVRDLDVDFLVCSSHKMLGPSGVGALFINGEVQDEMQPVIMGGQMVDQVSSTGWTPQPPPYCFEAGSPPAESVIGWGAAIEYLDDFGRQAISQRLEYLTDVLIKRLAEVPGVQMIGPTPGNPRGPLVTFNMDGLESNAIAKILNQRENVLVRSGFHCAQPLHQHLGLAPTVRASLQIYNTEDDLDRFVRTLNSIAKLRVM